MHPNPLPITLPVASFDPADYNHAEPGIHGLVDILKWEIWRWDEHNNAKREVLPRDVHAIKEILPSNHPMVSHLPVARTQLLENLSMFSEDLMETLLSSSDAAYLDIDSSRILPHLRKASLENNVLPVVCGSAIRHVGTDILMDYVGELFASPLDVPHEQTKNAPLRLLAWKVGWDKRKGWMTFVRVYSGW
jgi:elongation factor G